MKIKALILIGCLIATNLFAGSVSATGKGTTQAEAYANAMSKAPQGNYWKVAQVSQKGGNGVYYCSVIWRD